jgi:hypothetical protein
MRLSSVVFDDRGEVDERTARALAVDGAIGDEIEAHVDSQWRSLKIAIGVGIGVGVTGVLLLASGQPAAGVAALFLGGVVGAGGTAYVRSREPEPTVRSIEKGYWTGYLVPDGAETVVFDATETIEPRRFQLNLLDDPDRATAAARELDEIGDFPVVMDEGTDVEADFVDALRSVEHEIERSESHEVRAPVLREDDPALETVSRLLPAADADPIEAGGVSLSQDEAVSQVDRFDEFESLADEDHGESVLLDVSERSRELAGELTGLQETATELLNDHVDVAGNMFGTVSYHFYCPDCLSDDVESRLELVDRDGEWYCGTCRSNFAPDETVPRHRIRDDVVLDVWDQLWIEKDDERRGIYESIEDQKAELEEREFEQRREEIRSVEDRIKDIRSKIRDLQTEAKAKQGTVEEIGDLMVKYERLKENRVEDFRSDVSAAFEEIDEETERVLEETEGVVQDRIEEAEAEAQDRAEAMREEERQREREKVAYEQQRADERAEATADRQDERTAAIMGTIAATHEMKPAKRGED